MTVAIWLVARIRCLVSGHRRIAYAPDSFPVLLDRCRRCDARTLEVDW